MFKKVFNIILIIIIFSFLLLMNNAISENIKIKKYVIDTPLLEEKYPVSFGSGLFFLKKDNGDLIFLSITDRGPNVDSPEILIERKVLSK